MIKYHPKEMTTSWLEERGKYSDPPRHYAFPVVRLVVMNLGFSCVQPSHTLKDKAV